METNTGSSADLTVTDLQNIKSLIEVVQARGAFRAEEMTKVGLVYDRLSDFLRSVMAQQQAAQEAQQEVAQTSTE